MDPKNHPKLSKQPSNPISIGGKVNASIKPPAAQPRMARSMPAMKYVPPKAPTNKPSIPPCEPPPIELPPSPPIFNELDVQKELDKRAAAHMAAPSRSLNEYSLAKMLSTSAPPGQIGSWNLLPSSFQPAYSTSPGNLVAGGGPSLSGSYISSKNFTPAFDPLQENAHGEVDESDFKGGATSFSEPSTIFSMLKASSASAINPAPISLRASGSSTPDRSSLSGGAPQHGGSISEPPIEDVFQFSLSLDNTDESFMAQDESEQHTGGNYSLSYRD